MSHAPTADPFAVLGVPQYATEEEVRARYLELVKQFPPEREPEKFREIRAAFDAARNPLSIAQRMTRLPDEAAPQWTDVLKAQQQNPPRLTPAFILSLGNREVVDSDKAGQA